MRAVLIAALVLALGVGAVWVGKHAPVPSNRLSARELARNRALVRADRALTRRLRASARRATARERGRRRWAQRANRICRTELPLDRSAFRRLVRGGQSVSQLIEMVSRLVDANRRVLGDLEALPSPPGREGDARRMLGAYEKGLALNERIAATLRRGQAAGVLRMVQQGARFNLQGDDIARRLGADVCAAGIFVDSG